MFVYFHIANYIGPSMSYIFNLACPFVDITSTPSVRHPSSYTVASYIVHTASYMLHNALYILNQLYCILNLIPYMSHRTLVFLQFYILHQVHCAISCSSSVFCIKNYISHLPSRILHVGPHLLDITTSITSHTLNSTYYSFDLSSYILHIAFLSCIFHLTS